MRTVWLRFGDRVRIGHDISLTLIGVTGQSVTLKIDAPGRIAIAASELVKTPLVREKDEPKEIR